MSEETTRPEAENETPSEVTAQDQIAEIERKQKGFALRIPDWVPIQMNDRIILQMEREARMKQLASGIVLVGNIGEIDVAEKYKSPIPNDAVWFVVGYDPDINIKYRREKLKMLNLSDNPTSQYIKLLEARGELDRVRIGDQMILNNQNFMPVRIMDGFEVYFVAHILDIMGIIKCMPRDMFEKQRPKRNDENKKEG